MSEVKLYYIEWEDNGVTLPAQEITTTENLQTIVSSVLKRGMDWAAPRQNYKVQPSHVTNIIKLIDSGKTFKQKVSDNVRCQIWLDTFDI